MLTLRRDLRLPSPDLDPAVTSACCYSLAEERFFALRYCCLGLAVRAGASTLLARSLPDGLRHDMLDLHVQISLRHCLTGVVYLEIFINEELPSFPSCVLARGQ